MRQFVPCNGCGNQIPIPEAIEGQPVPQFLCCEECGRDVFWDIGLTNTLGPLIVFSIEDTFTEEIASNPELASEGIETPLLELELEVESATTPDWSFLGPTIPRPRPREISAFRKIIPPILGGLAAFPIATLIMWYVVGKDVGSTGPLVAKYVPWIVPQKLRSTPWEYSRNSESFGSFGPRSSSPTPRVGLPKLNRQESIGELSETSAEQPSFSLKEAAATKIEVSLPVEKDTVEKPSISETISKLRELQKGWNPSTPKADRAKMVGEFNKTIMRLSEKAAELKGPSSTIWQRELEAIAREILAHPKVPDVIQFGPIGQLSGIAPAAPGDFIATVIQIGDENSPAENAPWILNETWSTTTSKIPIEVMPGAWRDRSAKLSCKCLILGQLVANETSTGTILRVHAILPE